jgi:L-threonylcarbamoyladenylate synthase
LKHWPMETIKTIIRELKKGKVAVCPTDTVYGLIADASNKKAVNKIFRIKKRPLAKFLPLFVEDLKMAKEIAKIDRNQEKFLKKNWPGKTTIVLKRKRNGIGIKLYGLGERTVALRIPKYKLINDLLKEMKLPLIGTSANVSGRPASTKIKEVSKQFQGKRLRPDLIIDAGNLKAARPSIIIDLTGPKLKILRK